MSNEWVTLQEEMRACRKCLAAGYEIAPGAVFSGPAPSPLMLVGQAPGITEAEVKRPFNASSGTRLFQWLAEAGFDEDDFRARYYMTAVTKCYPGKHPKGKGDRKPTRAEQKLCRPFLERELALVQPRVLLAVGSLAIRTLLGRRLKLTEAVGQVFEVDGRYVLPLPHPSGASLWPNRPANQALIEQALALLREELVPRLGRRFPQILCFHYRTLLWSPGGRAADQQKLADFSEADELCGPIQRVQSVFFCRSAILKHLAEKVSGSDSVFSICVQGDLSVNQSEEEYSWTSTS